MSLIKIDELLKCKSVKELIDLWVYMAYEIQQDLWVYNSVKKKKEHVFGNYLRHRKFKMEYDIDLFFKVCEKIVVGINKTQIYASEKFDAEFDEECRQEGRFYGITALNILFEGGYNKTLSKYDLQVNCLQDFKNILVDDKKIEHLLAILYTAIKNMARKELYKHDNKGYYLEYYTEDGKTKTRLICKNDLSLDATLNDEDGNTLYNKIADENEDMSYKIDESKFKEESIINYIANNKNKIFMPKQLETLSKFDYNFNYTGANGNSNRKQIKEGCFNSLLKNNENDRFTYFENGQIKARDYKFIEFFEQFIILETKEQLELLTKELNKSTQLSNTLSEILYSHDLDVYKPIVEYNKSKTIDYKYINSKYKNFLYSLTITYNNKVQDEFKLDTVEFNNNSDKVKFFIDRKIIHLRLLARKENNLDIVTVKELITFINNTCDYNFTRTTQLNKYLMSIGYKIDTETRTSAKCSISCFRIDKYIEEAIPTPTKDQLDKIKLFIESNLVDNVILACTHECKYLKLCDVKQFIENELCREYKTKDIIELLQSIEIRISNKPSTKIFKNVSRKRISYYKVEKVD